MYNATLYIQNKKKEIPKDTITLFISYLAVGRK